MRILLDTHALLWMISDDQRLSANARQAILSATEIHWSIVSLWEIGIKESLNRFDLQLNAGWHEWIPAELQKNRVIQINVEKAHCHAVSQLDRHHRDPFDRMLIAQAHVEDLTLVTCDAWIQKYPVKQIW